MSTEFEYLLALYEKNQKMNEVFVEWRNKLLVFGSGSTSLTIAAVEYLRQHERDVAWVPGIVGFLLGLSVAFADIRNAAILRRIYKVGQEVEERMKNVVSGGATGFYSSWEKRDRGVTYGVVIKSVALLLGTFALVLSLV